MKVKNQIYIFLGLLFFLFFNLNENILGKVALKNIDNEEVIVTLKNAENKIKKIGIEKAIIEFRKNASDIFIGDYRGNFFVSPLHPELVGKNQFYFKDSTGTLVVQEEINKAKAGGGWLKGRWRKNPETGEYQCRKIYILPMLDNYFIGSWYHYSSNTPGVCIF